MKYFLITMLSIQMLAFLYRLVIILGVLLGI